MWSDECSAERGAGKSQVWCFGSPVVKWKSSHVETYDKGKDISVMVWGCFWRENGRIKRSDLEILARDFESKKMGCRHNHTSLYLKTIPPVVRHLA